jgi:hypothetical protein
MSNDPSGKHPAGLPALPSLPSFDSKAPTSKHQPPAPLTSQGPLVPLPGAPSQPSQHPAYQPHQPPSVAPLPHVAPGPMPAIGVSLPSLPNHAAHESFPRATSSAGAPEAGTEAALYAQAPADVPATNQMLPQLLPNKREKYDTAYLKRRLLEERYRTRNLAILVILVVIGCIVGWFSFAPLAKDPATPSQDTQAVAPVNEKIQAKSASSESPASPTPKPNNRGLEKQEPTRTREKVGGGDAGN